MTIQSVLHSTALDGLDAELLLAYTLGTDRSYIKAHPIRRLTLRERLSFLYYVWLLRRNTPIAYITGHKAFFGLDFAVNRHTLVPRPETELLVELVSKQVASYTSQDNVLLIDIGTGSGCIPIATLHTLESKSLIFHLQCSASDISKKALKIAQLNAKTNNVDITFKRGNLLEPWKSEMKKPWDHVIITANLPYITEKQWKSEKSIQKEPKSALVADEQGLALYRELLEQLHVLNLEYPITLYFEIDPDQKELIEPLVKKYVSIAQIVIHDDLCGLARIVKINIGTTRKI